MKGFDFFKKLGNDAFKGNYSFKKECPPKEVLQYWEGFINPIYQVELQNRYHNLDPARSSWKYIVHMARSLETEGEQRTQVLLENFEQQIRTWDIVSTSLL